MKLLNAFILLLLIVAPMVTQAQLEASVWPLATGKQFNFQSGSFEFSDFSGSADTKATICDKDGNLVLYTNGRTIWNRNHEIVLNGDKLIPEDALQINQPIFVPYPKKEGWYFLFYEEEYYTINKGIYDNALYYAEINTNANNGKGEVVKQKIKIHDNFHSGPTIAGYCNNSYFWLVNDRNDNTVIEKHIDRIYSYRINQNGVNLTPVISEDLDMGASGSYRFSPNGDKLFFHFGSNSGNDSNLGPHTIADFDFNTGKLYNYRHLKLDLNWSKEFSASSRFFYYFSGPYLLQLDARYTDINTVYQTLDTILTFKQNNEVEYPGQDLRLAPDGKIYFYYTDAVTKKNKLSRINKPNLKGALCEPELDLMDIESYDFKFPTFVSSFSRDKNPVILDKTFSDAGQNIVICSNSKTTLGADNQKEGFYHWSPEVYLEDPFSPLTLLSPQKIYASPRIDNYVLRVTDGNCWVSFDTAFVTVNPVPKQLPIDGSWSVCPFVEEVDYWTVDDKNKLQWLVDGGEIVSNPAEETVKISWGETNSNASASVFSTNNYTCNSDTSIFPVRINVELITETPKGPNKICIAERANVGYQIKKTTGSVYNWIPERGKVVKGQGTNKVVVNWFDEGVHKLSVEETSVTIDTICFGESEPLMVNVVNDSVKIELVDISFNPENSLEIRYLSENLKNTHKLFLIIQNRNGQVIDEIQITRLYNGEINYVPVAYDYDSEIISLKVENNCNEIFYSNSQQTITVRGRENTSGNGINLRWNINQFWENDRLEHEIWYSANGFDGWKLVATGIKETEFDFNSYELSLTFFFRIKEINRDKNAELWSNKIKVEVEDDLMIPDVFTPNGDGVNDEWQIKNIYFHQFKQLVIYNRFGEKVYECQSEFIPWDGKVNGEIFQGTYFYQIAFDAENIRNGQVTILQ